MIDLLKKIFFGLVITLSFFVLIELALSIFGVVPLHERTDPYVGFSGYSDLFVKNSAQNGAEYYETASNKLRWFNFQRFPAKKAEGVTRIFCVGGSTTYGRPYNDKTSFCGWLREFLKKADPSRKWEVINAGGISYASYRVARLMEELAEYEPDLFIVYSGHNEFLERRTYEKILNTPKFVRNLASLASRLRLYSLMSDVANIRSDILSTEVNTILDRSVGPKDYERDDQMKEVVLDHFRSSLNEMADIAEDSESKLIFVTPASNIADFSPFKSEPDSELSSHEEKELELIKQEINNLLEKKKHEKAAKLSKKAVEIANRDAELLYLRAHSLLGVEEFEEAKYHFIAARDEDICPLRALTPIHEIVKDVASSTDFGVVDFVRIVHEKSPDGIPGDELFLDHVHPTIEGNSLLAKEILKELQKMGVLSIYHEFNASVVDEVSKNIMKNVDDREHATALKNLSKVLSWAGKFDEAERLANLALSSIPDDGEAHFQKGILAKNSGNLEEALMHYQEAVSLAPWNPEIRRGLGTLLSEMGRTFDAKKELERAINLAPKSSEAHYDLGLVLQKLQKYKSAEEAYNKAIILDPTHADANNNLGILMAIRGNITGAEQKFIEALRLNPDHKGAAANLERARNSLSR